MLLFKPIECIKSSKIQLNGDASNTHFLLMCKLVQQPIEKILFEDYKKFVHVTEKQSSDS